MGDVIAITDLETTGLHLIHGHEAWEFGIILRKDIGAPEGPRDFEHLWRVKPDLSRADPTALRISRFYERTADMQQDSLVARTFDLALAGMDPYWSDPALLAAEIAPMLDGATLVGANVGSFDAPFLDAFLRANGQCGAWDYHYRDIGSLVTGYIEGHAAGYCAGWSELARDVRRWPECDGKREPRIFESGERRYSYGNAAPASPKLTDMACAVGIDPDDYSAHEALDDARLARDIYDRVMGGAR